MAISNAFESMLRFSFKEEGFDYSDIIIDILDEHHDKGSMLGPLCSRCVHSEASINLLLPSAKDCVWGRLMQLYCRCTKTLQERVVMQVYLANGKECPVNEIPDQQRHHSKIDHKIACVHLEQEKPVQKQQQPAQQQSAPQQQTPAQQAKPV
jgi:hypothetical protein